MSRRKTGIEGKVLTLDYDHILSRSATNHCYSLTNQHRVALLGLIEYLGWRTRWFSPTNQPINQDIIDGFRDDIVNRLVNPVFCGEPIEDEECFTYLPDSPFIEWSPNDPFTQPDLVTEGYNLPAWYVANSTEKTVQTDIGRFPPGSLPGIIPASGLPKFRLHVQSETGGIVEIHLYSIVGGSICQITIDDNPLSVRFVELDTDITSVPPETVTDVIVEVEVEAGIHHIDCIIVSQVNESIPFIHHGGGLKSVVLCGVGVGQSMIVPEFRFNDCGLEYTLDAGETWIPVTGWDTFADDCFTGEQGEPGEPGLPGADGADGADGQSVSINVCHWVRSWVYEVWEHHLRPFSESVQTSWDNSTPYAEAHDLALFLLDFPPDDQSGSQAVLDSWFDSAWNEATGNLQGYIDSLDTALKKIGLAEYYLSILPGNWDGLYDSSYLTEWNTQVIAENDPVELYFLMGWGSMFAANERLMRMVIHHAPYRRDRLCGGWDGLYDFRTGWHLWSPFEATRDTGGAYFPIGSGLGRNVSYVLPGVNLASVEICLDTHSTGTEWVEVWTDTGSGFELAQALIFPAGKSCVTWDAITVNPTRGVGVIGINFQPLTNSDTTRIETIRLTST